MAIADERQVTNEAYELAYPVAPDENRALRVRVYPSFCAHRAGFFAL
jgi:hypothetical protein